MHLCYNIRHKRPCLSNFSKRVGGQIRKVRLLRPRGHQNVLVRWQSLLGQTRGRQKLCGFYHLLVIRVCEVVRWSSLVTLRSIVQPAATSEHGNEPLGSAAGGTPFPLSWREYRLSDTYQHPPFTCEEDGEELFLAIALWLFEYSSHYWPSI